MGVVAVMGGSEGRGRRREGRPGSVLGSNNFIFSCRLYSATCDNTMIN